MYYSHYEIIENVKQLHPQVHMVKVHIWLMVQERYGAAGKISYGKKWDYQPD